MSDLHLLAFNNENFHKSEVFLNGTRYLTVLSFNVKLVLHRHSVDGESQIYVFRQLRAVPLLWECGEI